MKQTKNSTANTKKRNAFFSGVMILTVSNLLVKAAGLLFKVPMNYIVGDTGMGYYNSAYSIYTLFYMLSTAGLPVAISVMVSESRAAGDKKAVKCTFRLALTIFTLIGLAVSFLMFFSADGLSRVIKSEKSALSVAAAAPTMFFICISSAYRGYFQGCGNMLPTAVSQLIEAMGKLIFGIIAAGYAINMGWEIHIVAAYAVSGLTLGSLCSAAYLSVTGMLRMRKDRDLLPQNGISDNAKSTEKSLDKAKIIRRFIKISLPVTVSASVMSLTNMLDTAMIQRILTSPRVGMTAEEAATLFGNYTSLAVPMFNLPPTLVYPIAYSLVPAVAAVMSGSDSVDSVEQIKNLREKINRCLGYAVIIGLPCAMGLSTLAEPILRLLYKDSSAHMAANLLTLLAPSSFFVCVLALTNSVLQGCGREKMPVISMTVGGAVKLISGWFLIGKYGISGAPVSTFLCYLTVTVLNLAFVTKYTGAGLSAGMLFKPLVSSVACCICAAVVNYALVGIVGVGQEAACIIAVIFAAIVYVGMIFLTGAVKLTEISGIFGKNTMRRRKTQEI